MTEQKPSSISSTLLGLVAVLLVPFLVACLVAATFWSFGLVGHAWQYMKGGF